MIDVKRIKKYNKASVFGKYIYYFPQIDSTNSYAKRLAHEGAPEGTIVITDYQENGKGQRENMWESEPGKNILLSLVLRPHLQIEQVLKITLATAEIVVNVLEQFIRKQNLPEIVFNVKWPNDILANGKKIAGILSESSLRNKEIMYIIIGIGININQDVKQLSKDIREKSTSLLSETGHETERERLIADLITQFEKQYHQLERTSYSDAISDWKKRCQCMGSHLVIQSHSGEEEGVFFDINENGSLLYKTKQGTIKELISGSIKRMQAANGING